MSGSSNNLVYLLDGKIYINLTNRCTNDCIFCLRNDKDDVCGQKLWLDDEDFGADEVIEQLNNLVQEGWKVRGIDVWQFNDKNNNDVLQQSQTDNSYTSIPPYFHTSEVIFCGYGEPMLKLDVLKEVSSYIKGNYPDVKIRVNTNGHANFVYKRNVVSELKGLVDEFSVSLNGENKQEYNEYSQPKFDNAYEETKKFIKACCDEDIPVTASVVEGYKGRHLNLENCEKIAKDLGADFRVREWIKNGYG